MSTLVRNQEFSKIKEAVATWGRIRQLLRSGEEGQVVPVVIPKDRRRYGWLAVAAVAFYLAGVAVFANLGFVRALAGFGAFVALALALLWLWRGSIVEIEQGTTGILSRYGEIVGTLTPGRHYLWWPWDKVEAVVDTSTEMPYTAPVVACPTKENVPLKSIEFFLKFRIEDPVAFVRNIGASNFDMVLSSAVQDAIRQRSRLVQTERAYDLRGSDVGDMQAYLNRQMTRYGVRIIGANIPDVQLPDQYQQHLATRERVAKELEAYARELGADPQAAHRQPAHGDRARQEGARCAAVEVKAATNKAREDVARTLQEKETEAQRVRWEIEARGRATLKEAENEARGLQHLGRSYQDNRAVLQYELALRRLKVAEALMRHAPRPVVVRSGGGEQSALSTLVLAQMLPKLIGSNALGLGNGHADGHANGHADGHADGHGLGTGH